MGAIDLAIAPDVNPKFLNNVEILKVDAEILVPFYIHL